MTNINISITDYTKFRVGKVVERWTYNKRDGTKATGERRIEKCPTCGKNAIREQLFGTLHYVHRVECDTSSGFAHVRNKVECKVPALESLKAEYDDHYCIEVGCWREALNDAEGYCSKHVKGPTGGAIKAALKSLLETHRLGETQFDELCLKLYEKLIAMPLLTPKHCVKCKAVIREPRLADNEPERCSNCADPG